MSLLLLRNTPALEGSATGGPGPEPGGFFYEGDPRGETTWVRKRSGGAVWWEQSWSAFTANFDGTVLNTGTKSQIESGVTSCAWGLVLIDDLANLVGSQGTWAGGLTSAEQDAISAATRSSQGVAAYLRGNTGEAGMRKLVPIDQPPLNQSENASLRWAMTDDERAWVIDLIPLNIASGGSASAAIWFAAETLQADSQAAMQGLLTARGVLEARNFFGR